MNLKKMMKIAHERTEFLLSNDKTKMKLAKNLNQSEEVVPVDMFLHLYGYMNYHIYKETPWVDIKLWVSNDVQNRVTKWISAHFTDEEPYSGEVNIISHYTVLDRLYEKVKVVVSKHECSFKDNIIIGFKNLSIEEKDYQQN